MVSLYYAVPKEKETNCQKFNLSVQLLLGNLSFHQVLFNESGLYAHLKFVPPEKMDGDETIYKMKIEIL